MGGEVNQEQQIGVWLAQAVLSADGQVMAAASLSSLEDLEAAAIDRELTKMTAFDRQAGDFGAEVIGALLVPVLVEAARQLWASYLKELTSSAGKALAGMTLEQAKRFLRDRLREDGRERYAALVRAAAEREGLAPDQVDRLTDVLRQGEIDAHLAGQPS